MQRRDALKTLAALSLGASATARERPAGQPLGLVIHSYAVRSSKPLGPDFSPINDPLAFVEHAATLGAAGVQTRIGLPEAAAVDRLRAAVSRHGMYLEGIVALPKDEDDAGRFEAELAAARSAGAGVLRTVCLSGRRYETFDSRQAFDEFARRSWKSLTLAEPIARRQQVRLAVENHKDWRVDEMLGWLKRLGSEHVGVCLDTGNSMALLEEPHAVVEAYAPWTMTTHLKDMGVQAYDDGFLLSEVPFGRGLLDLPRIVATIGKARPDVKLNLEMITRDPLRVPCLTAGYWATMPDVRASELADSLARVRKERFPGALPTVSDLSHVQQLQAEAENIRNCLVFAEERLQG
ncbi:MAG TPA: sugar phosphate isomerase/epimerase family protein [Pirellulales bacterium]|nr:sugar phosphate isomerase/epimerase family protein [Pirellulales bacterium]